MVISFIHAISQCRSGRLINNTQHLKPCNLTGIFGSLALSIGKIGRHSNNRFIYFFPKITFRIFFQLLQHHSRNFLRSIIFFINFNRMISPHLPFNRGNSSFRIGDGLALSNLPHQQFSRFTKRYYGRRDSFAFNISNYLRFPTFHYCNHRVCCPKVNTDNFTHFISSCLNSIISLKNYFATFTMLGRSKR